MHQFYLDVEMNCLISPVRFDNGKINIFIMIIIIAGAAWYEAFRRNSTDISD